MCPLGGLAEQLAFKLLQRRLSVAHRTANRLHNVLP